MIEHGFGVARYRIRRTFRRRWAGYLSLVLLVGLVGWPRSGQPGRSPADAVVLLDLPRRDQSLGPPRVHLRRKPWRTAPTPTTTRPSPRPSRRLPDVRHVATGVEVTGAPLTADGTPRLRVAGLAYPVASVNGLFFTQDRLAVTQGAWRRRSGPTRS